MAGDRGGLGGGSGVGSGRLLLHLAVTLAEIKYLKEMNIQLRTQMDSKQICIMWTLCSVRFLNCV
jgi:hypothetical protein